MKKILTVAGTRPNFVKVAALSRKLREKFTEILVDTGQHYDKELSTIFFEELGIPKPDYQLAIGSSSHAKHTADILLKLEPIIREEKPDAVLVYGDTNSTLGGSLCASQMDVPVIHIEAGMRSGDPIPEERNRRIVDHLSNILFCSNQASVDNLKKEGIEQDVYLVGDLMIDALHHNSKRAEETSTVLQDMGIASKGYILATIHRAETTGDTERLKKIIQALGEAGMDVVLPLHPRTRGVLEKAGMLETLPDNIKISKPVSSLNMLMLEKNALKIVTDSGGVQKEAYFFGVPCITLRTVTEWEETVRHGYNKLVGQDPAKISEAIKTFEITGNAPGLYGDGESAVKIVEILREKLGE